MPIDVGKLGGYAGIQDTKYMGQPSGCVVGKVHLVGVVSVDAGGGCLNVENDVVA